MKFLAVVFSTMLMASFAYADHHEEKKMTEEGHDVEHKHVKAKADHKHDDKHHAESAEDHKAHHPDHDKAKATKK